MKSVAKLALLTLFLFPLSLAAAGQAQEKPTAPAAGTKGDGEKPLSISFGPQEGGGFGLVAKGSSYYEMTPRSWNKPREHLSLSLFTYLAPDVNFTSLVDKKNQASVSFRPTIQFGWMESVGGINQFPDPKLWPAGAPFATLYSDVRKQYGQFKNAKTNATEDVNNLLVGIGGTIAVPYFSRWMERQMDWKAKDFNPFALPMIQITYYKQVDHSESPQPLPKGITADQVSAALKTAVPLRVFTVGTRNVAPRFDFSGDLSRATTGDDRKWESRLDVALSAKVGDSAFKPVISYTSGEKLGFKYDKQILLGLAMEWLEGGR